jgi:hypothetical protein
VAVFLDSIDMQMHVDAFMALAVDGAMLDDTRDEDLVEMGVSQALQRRKILRKVGQARQHGLLVPLSSDPRAIALLLQARALPDDAGGVGAGAAETIGRKVVLADAQDVGADADADADAVAEEPTPRTRQQQQAMDWLQQQREQQDQ